MFGELQHLIQGKPGRKNGFLEILLLACFPIPLFAQTFTIPTPVGGIEVNVDHAGPSDAVVQGGQPSVLPFRAPSVFSAPLPSGSGARALGVAGAFTAIADDATAASWNPAGLTQLEHPEYSVVMRGSHEKADHRSSNPDLQVSDDETTSGGLNYFSFAWPFVFPGLGKNAVLSFNYQEAYDFTARFSGVPFGRASSSSSRSGSKTFRETQTDHIDDGISDITVESEIVTETRSTLRETSSSRLSTQLDFEQEGVISAWTPAFAMDLTPKLAGGLALNIFQLDPFSTESIRSTTRGVFEGSSESFQRTSTDQESSGTYQYDGTVSLPAGGNLPPIVIPVSGSGDIPAFSGDDNASSRSTREYRGVSLETVELTDLNGFNATFGVLYAVNRMLSIGAAVDLPWTASAEQRVTRSEELVTLDNGVETGRSFQEQSREGDVDLNFPLYWSLGAVLKPRQNFYVSLDLSQTRWSDFWFDPEGGPKVNPLSGNAWTSDPLDDTWSVRLGCEYLIMLAGMEIPLRAGTGWEERPAVGSPDDYYNIALGTGLALGPEDNRILLDFAYNLVFAGNVRGVLPSENGLRSDVIEHQGVVSVVRWL